MGINQNSQYYVYISYWLSWINYSFIISIVQWHISVASYKVCSTCPKKEYGGPQFKFSNGILPSLSTLFLWYLLSLSCLLPPHYLPFLLSFDYSYAWLPILFLLDVILPITYFTIFFSFFSIAYWNPFLIPPTLILWVFA